MRDTIRKSITACRRLFSVYPSDPRVAALRSHLAAQGPLPARGGSASLLAVQSVEDPFYFGFFSALLCDLRRDAGVRAELVVVRSISGAIGVTWRARLLRSVPLTWLLSSQWVRAYDGWADGVAYRSVSWAHLLGDLIDWFRSVRAWRQMRAGAGPFLLEVDGIEVGDLINDSYLRFRPAPRFDRTDPFVPRLIWQAFRDVRRARAYFGDRFPRWYLTSYSTYIEHGIAIRVALACGVRVLSFANFAKIGKPLTLEDWFHTPNCERYKEIFDALDGRAERLALAEQQLRIRLDGGIDASTSYMRVSAYSRQLAAASPDVRGAIVVFLHDFYDSPHVYLTLCSTISGYGCALPSIP